MRRLLRGLLAIATVPALYLLAALVGALIPAGGAGAPADGPVTVKLLRSPIHYDFLLPADEDTRALFGFAKTAGVPIDHPDVAWILVGWGARDFYTTIGGYRDVSASAILKGIAGDATVLRVDALGPVPDPYPAILTLHLTRAEYAALRASIARDITGAPALDHPGFSPTDAFFPATGPFNIFRTCNVWIGERLRDAGIGTGIWTPTPYAVTLSLARSGETG